MSPSALLVFATALAVACATPGPSTTALVARVLAPGPGGAPMFCAGLVIGDLVWLLCAALGVATLAEQFQPLFLAIKYAGAGYLLWLAWKFWTAPVAPAPASGATPTIAGEGRRVLLTGLSIALGNPKTMLFYVALLPGMVGLGGLSARDLLALALVVVAVVGAVLAAYALLAVRARRFIRSPRALRRVHRGSGVLMAGAAGVIVTR